MKIVSSILRGAGVALLLLSPLPVLSQAYPAKPVRAVVPYPPGGAPDLVTRLIAQRISVPLGQSVVVENRPGASSIIGTEYVARAAPDGYTILLGTTTTHVTNMLLMRKLPYDAFRDFTPIVAVLEGTRVASLPDVPTVKESVPGFEKPSGRYAFFGPAGLPQPIVSRLNAEIVKVLQTPDIRAGFEANAQLVIASSPAELAALMKRPLKPLSRQ